MSTNSGQLSRVLSALEDLASQEELLLHAEDYAEVVTVQVRMAPLINFLVAEVADADTAVRARISALVARRDRTQQRLDRDVGKMREEMVQLEASRRRIARVAPAYGLRSDAMTSPRLWARS
jgi:hypothetical protein